MQKITNVKCETLTNELKDLLNVVIQTGDIQQPETLGQRLDNALVDLYNYVKFPTNNKSGHKSGQIDDISKIKNLAVVDIDFHKTLNDMQKDEIRNKIQQELASYKRLLGLDQMCHGGLHIYCNLDDYPLKPNSIIKAFKFEDYEIYIFAAIVKSFKDVVLVGSNVRNTTDKLCKIIKYIGLNDLKSKTFLLPLQIMIVLFSINLIQKMEEERPYITSDGIVKIEKLHAELLINCLKGLAIHNDAQPVEKEASLLTLFSGLNGLIDCGFNEQKIEYI